jgi:hypothetical protein
MCKNNDGSEEVRPNYVIEGTNLFSNDDTCDWNIFIKTFTKEDYQFDGELCNTGYKKYYDSPTQGKRR